jgi:hypothetical protein
MRTTPFPITLLIAAATLSAAACAPTTRWEDAAGPRRSGVVVVAPLNLSVRAPAEIADATGLVWDELLAYVQSRGHRVAVFAEGDAALLWSRAVAGAVTDAERPLELDEAAAAFARSVGEERDYDLLLMPSLVLRMARVHGEQVSWDGVHRTLVAPPAQIRAQTSLGGHLIPAHVVGYRGRVPGVSLHVLALDREGAIVYQGMAGLDLVHGFAHVEGDPHGELEAQLVENPLSDAAHLREGIELAFERPPTKTARIW